MDYLNTPFSIVMKPGTFSHEQAHAVSKWVLGKETAEVIVIDLSQVTDATTAAFAALVLLRRQLLRDGRDLRVSGLTNRAQNVFNMNRLQAVLPMN